MSIRDLLARFACSGGPRDRAVSGSPDPDSRSKTVSSRTAEKRMTPDARAPECTAPLQARAKSRAVDVRAQHSTGVRDMYHSPPCIREMPLRRTVVKLCHEQHPLNRGMSRDPRDHTVLRTGSTIRIPNEFPDQHAAVNVRTIRTRHPAAPSARTQVAAVAPVVTTSSSSTTELPAGGRPL